jgi:hypothetical protein
MLGQVQTAQLAIWGTFYLLFFVLVFVTIWLLRKHFDKKHQLLLYGVIIIITITVITSTYQFWVAVINALRSGQLP